METKSNGKKITCVDLIKGIPFFSGLSHEDTVELERLMIRKRLSKNQIVLFEEDTGNYMYILCTGKVKVVHLSDEGKEQILAFHKRGDYFGELSLFDGKTSPATVIAMEETEVGLIAKKDFEKFIYKNEKVLYHFITLLCTRLRESWMMLKIMSFADAEQRVRAVLKNMSTLYGVRDAQGILLSLKLTHRDIANYASVSRETVSRLLSKFVKEGEIEVLDNRHILLKSPFLKNLHAL